MTRAWVADAVEALATAAPPEPALDLSTPCVRWPGSIRNNGYGLIALGGRKRNAHRVIYEAAFGVLPDELQVGHVCHDTDPSCSGGPSCQHRACINLLHLQAQTPAANSRATVSARKTECAKGHPFNEANTRIRLARGGHRQCRICDREALRNWRRRLREEAAPPSSEGVAPLLPCQADRPAPSGASRSGGAS